MNTNKNSLLVVFCLLFVTICYSQHRRFIIKNGIAIGGGITQFDIASDNFTTTAGNGWLISSSATGDLPNKWYNVSYGLQISGNSIEFSGYESNLGTENDTQIEYDIFAAQLAFMFHAKVVPNLMTIDAGPMVQYNGKLDLNSNNEENLYVYLNNANSILAKDIEDISQINVNGAIGATIGLGAFKFRAQYIYGFSNILNKLNNTDSEIGPQSGDTDFKGNQTMLNFMALITF
ncbi:hypothetical protein [Winogradskyella alexanderae]|uniref:Outer membrane protein beta-barrel domain-containing protein n=1 Tax=Winogradskyella alexanderae TaxID=2877123 RepID=A0ABS7XMP1_9FLAO|nr:hypothetical protein [Winogradskyella alexanderae]MCA0131269.1 hypothetical protein [Winogradskyella alexanderae]